MKYDSLIRDNKIKSQETDKHEIEQLFILAERDLKTAKFIMSQDWDWAFAIAYNSVLQASRAFMLNEGFRSRFEESHKITFEFMRIALGKEHRDLIDYFDRGRIKRHKIIYQMIGDATETEVRQILDNARTFIGTLKNLSKL